MARYTPALYVMIDGWDGGDPYGSALSLAFALADVAEAVGGSVRDGVYASLEYNPSPFSYTTFDYLTSGNEEVPYESSNLADCYLAGDVTDADLLLGARIISRYLDWCRAAGRDY